MKKQRTIIFYLTTTLAQATLLSFIAFPCYAGDYSFLNIPVTINATVIDRAGNQSFDSVSFSTYDQLEAFANSNQYKLDEGIYDKASELHSGKPATEVTGYQPFTKINFDIQGNNVELSSNAGSTDLQLTSDSLGINQSFTGVDRRANALKIIIKTVVYVGIANRLA